MINAWRRIALLLAVPGALALPGSADASYTTGSGAVAVYQYNVHQYYENWTGWIDAIAADSNAPTPDVILGQDFESAVKVIDFANNLTGRLGTSYGYVYDSSAAANKRAVFWRSARFDLLKSETWLGYGGTDDATCDAGANNAAAIQVKLQDKVNTSKVVAAVSMKTPPKGTNNHCTWLNMQLATDKLARSTWSGNLHLIGSDTNSADWGGAQYNCWWEGTVVQAGTNTTCGGVDLGWSDVIYDLCAASRSCLDTHWTHGGASAGKRIDYVLAKRGSTAKATSSAQATIDKGVCATYSDHCSVRAVVSYT
ncbi:MAG TPA: hypothetical protein VGX28_02345 [Frankiaceae bacterium]|jgi:hypothetical protein|nr:hypothetical protein [Frankiaceae bacterium]